MFKLVYEEPICIGVYEPRTQISCPLTIAEHMKWLNNEVQEHFCTITVNGHNDIIETRIITIGTLNFSPVHPREVFAPAITDRAKSIILVHNHPSGDPEPSVPDIDVTKQLIKAGEILGIDVLDHIVIAKNGFVSLKERGLI